MSLTARDSGGGSYTPAPEGTHAAVCFSVIDLGTQYAEKWGKHQHKVLLGWELDCEEKRDDGGPLTVWRRYTMSLHAKAGLRKDLESWRGKKFTAEELNGFGLDKLLGKGCLITITHQEREGSTYANVAAISALPRGMTPVKPTAPLVLFDIDAPDMALFATFGDRLREQIESATEWQDRSEAGPAEHGGGSVDADDIPF